MKTKRRNRRLLQRAERQELPSPFPNAGIVPDGIGFQAVMMEGTLRPPLKDKR